MTWRSVIISKPAALLLENKALKVVQGNDKARLMLEDVSVIVLDHPQISISGPLLSACAEAQVVVICVNAAHLPNGVLLPFLPHSRALKVMTAQLALNQPTRKRLWQRIIRGKIGNQATVLTQAGQVGAAALLRQLAADTRSGDSDNHEAQAAHAYFRGLFQTGFHRAQSRFYNAALNYGYAVMRAALARTLVSYGFLPAFGLFHHNEQNAFNLADDLIEPYRPLLDAWLLAHYREEPNRDLQPNDKATLVALLHQDVTVEGHAQAGKCTLLAAIDAMVASLSSIVMLNKGVNALVLPLALSAMISADDEP